jgi:beta-glucosidase/6-phospho-beta-glucosidase/beta-galactosidase
VEQFSFETGTYMRVGQPLREGYSFKERDELYAAAMVQKAKSAKAAKEESAQNFKASLMALPMATNSGNTMDLRKQGSTIQNDVYNLVSVGCYGQLAEHAVKLAECDSRVVMLIQADETSSKLEGDYKIDIVTKNYYLSIVNSNSKYEKINLIGKDVHETHTNKHTMKVEKSGWHSTPTNFTWSINNETITINSSKGTFSIDAQSCIAK